jgi:hypothetical protein
MLQDVSLRLLCWSKDKDDIPLWSKCGANSWYPWPLAVIWKSPWTLFNSKLPKIRQLSPPGSPPLNLGVLPNLALLPLAATISWTCSSPNPSSWNPSPVISRPCASVPSLCMPLLSAHWCQFVGSLFSLSAANILSPAASCTLMWMSLHFILSTMSKLICKTWPTPFSTAKVCVSCPRHQRVNSEKMRRKDTMSIATVHFPPPEVRVTYWGFDFAVLNWY